MLINNPPLYIVLIITRNYWKSLIQNNFLDDVMRNIVVSDGRCDYFYLTTWSYVFSEKVETTYKSRVKSLEERLKSQKQYYIWKIEDVKKNTLLETVCDEAIKDEIFKKDAQIEVEYCEKVPW